MYIEITCNSDRVFAIKIDTWDNFHGHMDDEIWLEREDGGVFATINPEAISSVAVYASGKYHNIGYTWNFVSPEYWEAGLKDLA